ncbi:hypothetical protein [Paracidovorax oryzae]|uniref:hypothetical protein n=1 Tax=Paracidovorax oryzae TaxID=862720 RepID=UPI0012EBD785|nr:hypothetical protein [Paracidovorax oryzae]
MIVIAVVATIYTAGLLTGASGALGETLVAGAQAMLPGGMTIAEGAIAGAVGSVASQAVGIAIGAQKGFNWKSVGLAAVSSGVTAGLGNPSWLPDLGTFGNAAMKQAVSGTISQGIGTVLGLQPRFDWKGVVAGAIGAGVGATVGSALDKANAFGSWGSDFATGLARGTVSGFAAGMTTAVLKGGRVRVQQVATDAFGHALGSSLAEASRPETQGQGPWSDAGYRNGSDIESDNYNPASAYGYRNGADIESDNFNPASAYGYRNGMDMESDAFNPASAYGYRNGMDVASDTYNGSRRTVTIGEGQGPLAAMAAMGFNEQQQRAMYGQLVSSGQLSFDAKGMPVVQSGQELYVDLDDMSGARLGGRLIAAESGNRAAIAAAEQRAYWDSLQVGAWSGRTGEGGPVWHVGGAGTAGGSLDVRGVVDRANNLAYSKDLTREQLLGALGEVRSAMGSAGSNEQQLWLQGAALSLHEAGASRGLMRPGETVNSPEMLGLGVVSMAFGGSSGSAPKSVLPSSGYAGPSYRSAFRAFNSPDEVVTFPNRFSEDAIELRSVPALTPEQALRMPKNILYVVKEDGGLVIAPRPKDFSYGHVDLARGENVLAAGEGKVFWGEVKFIDNASGHYLPQGPAAQSAAVKAFTDYGFKVPSGAYQDKVYDFKLRKWVAK